VHCYLVPVNDSSRNGKVIKLKALLIAGTTSGVGKTTIATGLMGILHRRGYKVQPFKTGPDYIDPGYHNLVTGEISRNLDTWLLSYDSIQELFTRAMKNKDIAIIEGVMGLYDGHSPVTDEGSTAELAKLLSVPIVLVIDSRKGARSLAAMVKGYQTFDPDITIAGVILNGIGSDRHLEICSEAILHYCGVPVLGHLPRHDSLSLPERHLGLVPTAEQPASAQFLENLISRCEATFDITEILQIAEQANVTEARSRLFPATNLIPRARIGVAKDKAFSFYYQDSLDLLEAWGAELVFFSPITDSSCPEDISGLYIGGGFPELYTADLAANDSMRTSLKTAIQQGMPVYAECGGLMYLGENISDFEGKEYPMVGYFPVRSRIDKPRLSLGYRTVQALGDGPLLQYGETVRGHEFHWSVLAGEYDTNAYRIVGSPRREGFQSGNTLASYIHIHMASQPGMIHRFISLCEQYKKGCGAV
jgi:cobyrinic acid a,c-diamide synthase